MLFLHKVFITLLAVVSVSTCLSAENVSSNTVEKARAFSAAVKNAVSESGAMRDMAVIAVRNAKAAENEAVELFFSAVKTGDRDKRVVAMKKMTEVSSMADEAMDMLKEIADSAGEVVATSVQAKQCEKEILASETEPSALSKLRQLEKLSVSALKITKKVHDVAENMKNRWLLPIVSEAPTSGASVDESKVGLPSGR